MAIASRTLLLVTALAWGGPASAAKTLTAEQRFDRETRAFSLRLIWSKVKPQLASASPAERKRVRDNLRQAARGANEEQLRDLLRVQDMSTATLVPGKPGAVKLTRPFNAGQYGRPLYLKRELVIDGGAVGALVTTPDDGE